VILGDNGQHLELYPLLHLGYANGQLTLSSPNADHPARRLLDHPALNLWLERYNAERAGLIEFQPTHQEPEPDSESQAQLRAALGSDKSLILVEAHPGCGANQLIEGLTDQDPRALGLERFAAIQRVRVTPSTPSQSGLTIGCMVLRLVERALGEAPRSRQGDLQNLLKTQLPSALAALKDSGKRVLLGIDQLHEGASVYRGEPLSVIQVYEALAESSVTVVASTITGCLDKPIYDHNVTIAVAQTPNEELVRHWSQRLAPPGSLHHRVLHALSATSEAVPMFTLCDTLEAGDQPRVFEPAVERALWDLRPLLEWRREERTVDGNSERLRLWRLFSPTLNSVLTETSA
jgi:hypothetical protein